MEKSLFQLDEKINFYKEAISEYFKNVERKSKVNMTWKFSQLKLPSIDFDRSPKEVLSSHEDKLEDKKEEIEDEVDLLNLDTKDIDPQMQFLDQVHQTQSNPITTRKQINKQSSLQAMPLINKVLVT